MIKLLTRDEFRESVFKRDGHKCVICNNQATEVHHIMERRLFEDGGYYEDNGSSLCSKHHILAEQTVLSCEEIRTAAGIQNVIIPEHLYDDNEYKYDKWSNIILPNGTRLKGDLFFDESVQKILQEGEVLHLFSKYVKHPRTFHLPWSEKLTDDDKKLGTTKNFLNKEVIVTVKLDGEQTTMYNDYIHARSIYSGSDPARNWVKGLWSRIGYEIPEGWRVCGENMYEIHTIKYNNLKSYFFVHSIWNEKNICLSWKETKEYCELLGLLPIPVLYEGIFNEKNIKSLYKKEFDGNPCEGYVLRIADEFTYSKYKNYVAKFVSDSFIIKHRRGPNRKIETNLLIK